MQLRWPRSLDRGAVVVAVAIAGSVWIAFVQLWTADPMAAGWLADLLTGVGLIVVGTAAASVGESPVPGLLVVFAGCTWFLGNLSAVDARWLASVAGHAVWIHRGALAAAAMSSGRSRPVAWTTIVAVAVPTAVGPLMRSPSGSAAWGIVVLLIAVVPPVRLRGVSALPAVVLGLVVFAVGVVRIVRPAVPHWLVSTYELGLLSAGGCVLAAVTSTRVHRERLADAVAEVALGPAPDARRLLGNALGEREVDVAFATDDGWVDESGRARSAPLARDGGHLVDVAVDGRRVAQIACDADLAAQTALMRAIERATALVARNARLRADVRAEAVELERSRRRLLVAADEQRVRLSSTLDAATVEPIAELAAELAALGRTVDPTVGGIVRQAGVRLDLLREDLRALASGLGPTSLAAGNLQAALHEMVASLDLSTSVHVDAGGLDPGVAAALYFVCAEAVSNTVKHAAATRLWITLETVGKTLRLVVGDDGAGGARPSAGSGLRGLADRVAAFGGSLLLDSPEGHGTSLRVTLPRHPATSAGEASPIRTQGTPK